MSTSPDWLIDLAAFVFFVVSIVGYGYVTSLGPLARRTIAAAVQAQRVRWMENMAVRDTRIVDAHLLGGLSQGNAFFASTSAIIIGGLTALVGAGDKVQALIERLPAVSQTSAIMFEVKLMLMIAILVFAFFKFAWAFRLSHYAAIMIGATPILGGDNQDVCLDHARRTARLVGLAGDHANAGIRSYYYAMAAMAWFIHPLALVATTLWVMGTMVRRDFFSRSRRLLLLH